jgi:signal transduction histidine kinase
MLKEQVIGLKGTDQDITPQKQAEIAKSEFLSSMSHEIRTPINGVIGIANLLMEEQLSLKQREYVETLKFSAQHLSSIVSDILDFSKIESGKLVFESIPFNLNKVTSNLFRLFETTAKEKSIALTFVPDPRIDYLLSGDYVRLSQILSNLLSNAIKFTEKGTVELAYTLKEETQSSIQVNFTIKDTGIGISASTT